MNNAVNLVILAGGKGTRIKKHLGNFPKPMVKFNKKNFLDYHIKNLSKFNFKKIYIITGYKHKYIHNKFHNKKLNLIDIECIKEKKLKGTAGALFVLKKKIKGDFVLTNGDTIFDININFLLKSLTEKSLCSIALIKKKEAKESYKLNKLILKNNKVIFGKNGNLVNGGIYFFKQKFLKYIDNKFSSLENDIIPLLVKKRLVNGKVFDNFFLDIGTPKTFKQSSKKLLNYFKRPAVFLDRDGVINYDFGHVYKFKDFKFRPHVLSALSFLNEKKYYIFVVTNQSAIHKGSYSAESFIKLHKKIRSFLSRKNIFIDGVQYAPYHQNAKIKKYKKKSLLRKPGNLMLKNIMNEWHIDTKRSFMIGDQISDQIAARKSKLYFEFVKKDLLGQIKKINKRF